MAGTQAAIEALKADPDIGFLHRSLEFYYGDPRREAAMDELYSRFVSAGDLVFDIGAHVGDRIGSFRRLGARVVAVEPHPICGRAIRAIYGADDQVTLVEAVCGAHEGRITFHLNSDNPTVSTASTHFIRAAEGATGWEDQVWDRSLDARAVRLDNLIDAYGEPVFAKIDVEGFEEAVLAGLTRPFPALSFEFTTIEREAARHCLDRLAALGFDGFDVALGESMRLTFERWVTAAEMAAHLRSLPHRVNSGDVYCRSRAGEHPADHR